MNIKGYDTWRLSGPPEWEGPTCDCCGTGEDIRVDDTAQGVKPSLTCSDCYGPDFDDLQTADDYAQEQAERMEDER